MTTRYFSTWHYLDEGLSDMPVVRASQQVQIMPLKTLKELDESMHRFIELEGNPNMLILGVIATAYLTLEGTTITTEPIRVRTNHAQTHQA